MSSFSKRLWRWSAGLFAALVIFAGILVGLFRVAVLHAPEYRLPLQEWASSTLGLPVEIGRMDARFRLDGPELVLYDTAVLSADGSRVLMRADEGSVSLNVSRLLLNWQVQGDVFTLDGAELEIRRDADGEIHVLGVAASDIQPRGGSMTAELRLLNSTLVIRDALAGGEIWRFEDAEANVSSGSARLRIDGSVRPPAAFGGRIEFWVDSTLNAAGARRSTSVFADLEGLDLTVLRRLPRLKDQPPMAGRADLTLSLNLVGAEPRRVVADIDVEGLTFDGAAVAVDGAGFQRLEARLGWNRAASGWELRVEDLLVTRQGRSWRSPLARVETSRGSGQDETTWLVEADFLRLQDLRVALPLLPAGDVRRDLAALQPGGDLRDVLVKLVRRAGETPGNRVTIQTRMDDVSARPLRNIPGFAGISGQFRSDEQGGRVELDADRVTLELPALFRNPLAFDRLSGLLVWRHGADELTMIADSLSFANADLAGNASGQLRLPRGDGLGAIDIGARLDDMDLSRASRYLPVGIMKPTLVGWLDRSIVAGRVPRTTLELHGPLRGFPYRERQGQFEVSFGVEDLRLDYAEGWPLGENISGDFLFANESLSADLSAGQLGGMDVEQISVSIPDLPKGQLTIAGNTRGPLQALHEFVVESPVGEMLGAGFAATRIQAGDGNAVVDLLLPLQDMASREIGVDVDLVDGQLFYADIEHPLAQINGRLQIDGSLVTGDGITAQLAGEPVVIDVAPHDDGATRAHVSGETTDRALLDVLRLPLEGYLQGRTAWQGYIHFPSAAAAESGDRFHMVTETDLEGMAITLPAPLAKQADESLPLTIAYEFPVPDVTEWHATLGDRLGAVVRFDTADTGLRFLTAGIQAGSLDARLPEADGLSIKGHLEQLSVDEWVAVRFSGDDPTPLEQILRGIDLHVSNLIAVGQHYPGVSVQMTPADNAWQITADSETVSGTLQVPFDLTGGAPIVADLERLALDDSPQDGTDDDATDPNDIPALQGSVDAFLIEGLNLGRIEVRIDEVPGGIELTRFRATGAEFTIEADGRSVLTPIEDETRFRLVAESTGVGDTLEFMGFDRSIDSKSGRMELDLSWTGGLPASVFAVAQGTASIEIKNGNLIEVKPGAGRVFGLLSVQALPRRLILDFRDVFKKGFFFDKLRGDFTIAAGEAYTENLVFRSPAADIGIVGSVDLLGRSYDQTAVVSAEVGNTLPVVGAIAAGPIIGAGLFVLKEILKDPLSDIAAIQYHITGPWDDPIVERVAASDAGSPPDSGTQISRTDSGADPDGG